MEAGGDLGKTGSGLDERLYALQDPNWNVVALFGEEESTWRVLERYLYAAYGQPIVRTPSFGDRSSSDYDWEYLYTGRRLDQETTLYYYRARHYHSRLGRFIRRDPIESDLNLYRYGANNPVIYVDPFGLAPSQITGPCNIWIFAGHGIWPIVEGVEDPAVTKFREAHDVPNKDIVNYCGNYLAYVGCEGKKLNAGVTDGRGIPGYTGIEGSLASDKILGEVRKALKAARKLQKKLCANRKKFCDDGKPERYRCGKDMQRCDSVTIHVSCDADMTALMEKGIYRQRLFPATPSFLNYPVQGLPTKESKSICGLNEKVDCNKK